MMILCSNVEQLSLLPGTVNVDFDELRIAVQHMEHLEKLEVQLSTDVKPLLQIGGLKELTVHVPKQYHLSNFILEEQGMYYYSHKW